MPVVVRLQQLPLVDVRVSVSLAVVGVFVLVLHMLVLVEHVRMLMGDLTMLVLVTMWFQGPWFLSHHYSLPVIGTRG